MSNTGFLFTRKRTDNSGMGKDYPSDWNSRRKKVYRRDNFRCQKCGARGGSRGNTELHAHHKKPKSKGGSHRLGNLTTVCKSCHEGIHGHAVGGRTTSGSKKTDQKDPYAGAISMALIGIVAFLAITYGAVQQTLPAGETVDEEYIVDYGSVTEDEYGNADHDHHVGAPLLVHYELADSVISDRESAELTVTISNPSNNQLSGSLEVQARSSYSLQGELSTISFDLAPGESTKETFNIPGYSLVASTGTNPRTTVFNARGEIYNEPYREISTKRRGDRDNRMILKIRKPFFYRLGVYWLGFLAIIGIGCLVRRSDREFKSILNI